VQGKLFEDCVPVGGVGADVARDQGKLLIGDDEPVLVLIAEHARFQVVAMELQQVATGGPAKAPAHQADSVGLTRFAGEDE
jgi:hypothetical protein